VARSLNVSNAMNFDYSKEGTNSMFAREIHCRMNFYDEVSECKDEKELREARRSSYFRR
jgi:hypothetical protein